MPSPDPMRVAGRYIQAREELREEDLLLLEINLEGVERVFAASHGGYHPIYGNLPFASTVRVLRKIAPAIVQNKVLTPKQVKIVEAVSRAAAASRTNDVGKWFQKNLENFKAILAMKSLPDRSSTSGSDTFMVGPFTFHNTIHADKSVIAVTSLLMEDGWKYLSREPKLKVVAYGDIFLVGNMLQSNTSAWYNIQKDDVYLRPLKVTTKGNTHSLLHELGHRHWYKFLDSKQKDAIRTLYFRLSYARNEGLRVGDVLPVEIRGFPNPVVVKVDSSAYWLNDKDRVSKSKIDKYLNYPSAYASKTVEEFYAECFAFYLMGKLKPELEEKFLVSLGMQKAEVVKVDEVKPEHPKPEPVVVAPPPVMEPPKPDPVVEKLPTPKPADSLQPLRDLYVAARTAKDQWTMGFAESLAKQLKAGQELTFRQRNVLESKYRSYGISFPSPARVASRIFDIV